MELDKNLRKNPIKIPVADITSLPSKVLLYQKAGLHLIGSEECAAPIKHRYTEMNIMFTVNGERDGVILCSLDLASLQKVPCNLTFLQGLFIESMNIWLGNYLSNLENNYGILCVMSPPSFFVDQEQMTTLAQIGTNVSAYQADYVLILFETSIPITCSIQWNKRKTREI